MNIDELKKIKKGTLLKITKEDKSIRVGFFIKIGKVEDRPWTLDPGPWTIIWTSSTKNSEGIVVGDQYYTYLTDIESVHELQISTKNP